MPTRNPRPSRRTEFIALAGVLILASVILVLYFTVPSPQTSPIAPPTSEAAGTDAPGEVETPESARPIPLRDSN